MKKQNGVIPFGHEEQITLYHELEARFQRTGPSLITVLRLNGWQQSVAAIWLETEGREGAIKRPAFLRRYK